VIVPDANLLLYAYDLESPFHKRAKSWWEGCLSGQESVGLTYPTLFAFLRISTNGKIYTNPMTLTEAAGHMRSWLACRVSQILEPPVDHTEQVVGLLEAAGGTAGNLVTDAQIAAFAQSYRAVVHTADRDFLRFPDIRCHFPLDQ
jgi:toxin-antitoxin system PIN domain toxin